MVAKVLAPKVLDAKGEYDRYSNLPIHLATAHHEIDGDTWAEFKLGALEFGRSDGPGSEVMCVHNASQACQLSHARV